MSKLRENNLKKILANQGLKIDHSTLRYPKQKDITSSNLFDGIQDIYKKLGGVLDEFPLNLRKWDINLEGVAVELDEDLHFNRYRSMTLESPLYNTLPNFPLTLYKHYTDAYEHRCLKAGSYGGKWSNPSTEKQFGIAGQNGVLKFAGSPRWKQRAFYDFVKDFSYELIGIPVVRLSIWDEINHEGQILTLDQILKSNLLNFGPAIVQLINTRSNIKIT